MPETLSIASGTEVVVGQELLGNRRQLTFFDKRH
jgi:hypothetical protein